MSGGGGAPRRASLLLAAALAVGASTAPVPAQVFRYLAFGDSITEGDPKYDEQRQGGYPARLETDFLGCTPSTCEVANYGKGGRTTGQGVTQIEGALDDGPWDVLLLMLGTNDVWGDPPVDTNTIAFNLGVMAFKAEEAGAETLHASTIWLHPEGKWGRDRDGRIEDLRDEIRGVADDHARSFADPWSRLCPQGDDQHGHTQDQCFSRHGFEAGHYSPINVEPNFDTVGHPNASGFSMLAAEFFEQINAHPVPTAPTPTGPIGDTGPTPRFSWNREDPQEASWYHLIVDGPQGRALDAWYSALATCTGASCAVTPAISLVDGTHTWQIQGRDLAGRSPWSEGSPFEVYATPPGRVTLRSPSGDLFSAPPLDVEYRWNEVDRATDYLLQVSSGPDVLFEETYPADGSCSGGICSVVTGNPLGAGSYSWQVRAENPAGPGSFSTPLAFTIWSGPPPAAPLLGYPDRAIFNTRPQHQWLVAPGSSRYRVRVFDGTCAVPGATLADVTYDAVSVCTGGACAVQVLAPPADPLTPGPYCWRVQPRNPFGPGPEAGRDFTVLACSPERLTLESPVPETGTVVHRACVSITAGSDPEPGCVGYRIANGADVTLHGGEEVRLRCGFEVDRGGRLTILTDP